MKHQGASLASVAACIVATISIGGIGQAQANEPVVDANNCGENIPEDCPQKQTQTQTQTQTAPQPQAQAPYTEPPPEGEPMSTGSQLREYGLGLSAGGGASDWFDRELRNVTGLSGTWEVRGYVGLNKPLGIEVAYVGRASSIEPAFGPGLSSTLVGNGVEVAGRVNIFHDLVVQPYAIVGIGWTHFSVSDNVTLADFGMNDSDDILEIPLGAGAAWRGPFNLLVDARFTFRPALGEDLVVGSTPTINGEALLPAGEFLDMDTWEASARIGYQF